MLACVSCNPTLHDAIFNDQFWSRLFTMVSLLPLLAGGVALVAFAIGRKKRDGVERTGAVSTIAAVTTVGVGMGGFVDGIVFHQILQWHEMFSNMQPTTTLLNKSVNMFWDGIFHAATWCITLSGIVWVWRLYKRNVGIKSLNILAGGLITGWALFNVIEGTVNHYILGLHHVKEASPNSVLYDHAFVFGSVLLLATGWWLTSRGLKNSQETQPEFVPPTVT